MRRRTGATRAVIALLWSATTWALVGFLVALLVLATGGEFGRYQVMSVLSGSMVPTLEVGDLVVARVVSPAELEAGELATFREPESGRLITHRVQSVLWHGDVADVVTRGDANETGENWSARTGDRVGHVVLRIPHAGYVVGTLSTPAGQLGLVVAAAVLGVWILVLLWRPSRSGDAAVADPGPASECPEGAEVAELVSAAG